ncbi:hypothetical protein [uncultured Ilyobacter sp.]|uniref:hypothetical protein n=1 Tax=uncultured Ilyobacter sp. TaxID=544433 RepID=UPI0029C0AA5A|nr:hypothetical protein [uncultured Ilyobacter sp.]
MNTLESLLILEEAEAKLKNKENGPIYEGMFLSALEEDIYIEGEPRPLEKFRQRVINDGEENFFKELLKKGVILEEDLGVINF